MQSELDNGEVLYNEYVDISGFIVREMNKKAAPDLRYQAGRYKHRRSEVPVFDGDKVTRYAIGDEVRVFHLLGFGDTLGKALDNASNLLFKKEIYSQLKKQ